jgi:putative ABC transport system permease protein
MTLRSALRDLQWRRRRVLVAVCGTPLVFSMALVLAGVSHGFDVETNHTMAKFRADGWIVGEGAAGPFIGQSPLPASIVESVRREPGITDANPVIFSRKTVGIASLLEVNLFGVASRGVAVPVVDHGRGLAKSGEIVVSTKLNSPIGRTIYLARTPFRVVGGINNWTAMAGVPNVMVTLADARRLAFLDEPIISAIAVTGTPRAVPRGTRYMPSAVARRDLLRALKNARAGIALVDVLLWIVAGTIIGSVIYLSALERTRDFAVFKATGTSSLVVLVDLATQAMLVALASAIVATGLAKLLAPLFPIPVVIPSSSLLSLPLLAVTVGLVASVAGLRRAVTVDPAIAMSTA